MNYGGLGTIVGHEIARNFQSFIGHSFDTRGRKYNKYGENFKEYWDPKSVERYNKWVLSITKDYGSEIHKISDNSVETVYPWNTVNEDIADILGVFIGYYSYQAYLQELEDQGKKELVLPGLKSYTPQKLFFMKYTNSWCDKKDVQYQYFDLLMNHSPGNARATVPLKRAKISKHLAETFDCPAPKMLKRLNSNKH